MSVRSASLPLIVRCVAIEVRLEDVAGNAERAMADPNGGTFDAAGGFDRLLPPWDDESFACWRFVDPYGDTVFNSRQMPSFLDELDRLARDARHGPEERGMRRIRVMAERCRDEPHLYLRFVGD
jgi:hypothetical protein